jgi:hypothetical protein
MSKMRGHGSQWFSHKIDNRQPLQLKKSKSWEPVMSRTGENGKTFDNLVE